MILFGWCLDDIMEKPYKFGWEPYEFITSVKEVMFLPVFVCLSVCLFVCLFVCVLAR